MQLCLCYVLTVLMVFVRLDLTCSEARDINAIFRGVNMNENATNELLKYTKALVSLQIYELNLSGQLNKPEVLLSRAGLGPRDIAEILGKNPGAVAKALQRAGKGNG